MRPLLIAPLLLGLGACGDNNSPQEKAAADAKAVAEVEANQIPPPEDFAPQAILYPDIEKNDLFGAGCSFVPEGGGLGAVALALAEAGYMKRGGKILRFAPDIGSAELPYLAHQQYDGREWAFKLELDGGKGESTGPETENHAAKLTVTDSRDRVVYQADGIAQCGA